MQSYLTSRRLIVKQNLIQRPEWVSRIVLDEVHRLPDPSLALRIGSRRSWGSRNFAAENSG
jgi:hypothetical protein